MEAAGQEPRATSTPAHNDPRVLARKVLSAGTEAHKLRTQARKTDKALKELRDELEKRGLKIGVEVIQDDE